MQANFDRFQLSFQFTFTVHLPNLVDLIVKENDKSFNVTRWSLFQWLIGLDDKTISKINDAPKHLQIVLMTLMFLLAVSFDHVKQLFYL